MFKHLNGLLVSLDYCAQLKKLLVDNETVGDRLSYSRSGTIF